MRKELFKLEYQALLKAQFRNLETPGIKQFYTLLFQFVDKHLDNEEINLELGAGAGGSVRFLNHRKILRTDFLHVDNRLVRGGIDAHKLPFSDHTFGGVFAVDMIHHCREPATVLREMLRVCKPEGRVILVEPYVSLLSFPIYKLFHSEEVTWPSRINSASDLTNDDPAKGNQSILQTLMKSKDYAYLKNLEFRIVQHTLLAPISFFLTGGINNPLKINGRIIKKVFELEKVIPVTLLKYIASRHILVLEKLKQVNNHQ
jgi:SAM-dependent methyltransferase